MTTTSREKLVGEVIRVEFDQETGEVRIVMEITDEKFKLRVLHNKDFQDILNIKGKDVMIVASKSTKEEE